MHKSKNNFSEITKCRLCGSKKLKKFIDFGCAPLGNNLQETKELSLNVESYSLKVMRCNDCQHFQLSVSVSPELLYATNYTYLSGIGPSFVDHIKNYVVWVLKKTFLKASAVIVDIGSNDGTCLKYFKQKGYSVCGVDPAQKPAEIANINGIFTINNFFDTDVAQEIIDQFGQVDIVTSQNVLAHVDNLISTFENIYKILKNDGYFVFEIGYFKNVIETKCFDTIYHEHIDYHHANPLVKMLVFLGFDVINISENNIQGGSLRMLLQKTGLGIIKKQPKTFLENEKKSILYDSLKLNTWSSDIQKTMSYFNKLFSEYKSKEKICFAYGAPTKSTLLLKMSKLKENEISFVVDDNDLKVGKFLPSTSIPIKSNKAIEFNKEAVIIVFAWNFADDIIKNLKKRYIVPVTVIIPLPCPRVVKIC
jgi:SAM-dependent methyltransferase